MPAPIVLYGTSHVMIIQKTLPGMQATIHTTWKTGQQASHKQYSRTLQNQIRLNIKKGDAFKNDYTNYFFGTSLEF